MSDRKHHEAPQGPDIKNESRPRDEVATGHRRKPGEESDSAVALQEEVDAARRVAAECNDKYLRARADMENYKKRLQQTYADLAHSSKKALLQKLLNVKDNLERALQYGGPAPGACAGLVEGVRLTESQLDQLLLQEGVKQISSQGKPFDPRFEEAVQSVTDTHLPEHVVVQEVRKGYTYGDNHEEVLRPAQVVVNVHSDDR